MCKILGLQEGPSINKLKIGFFVGIVSCLLVGVLPFPSLTPAAHRLAAITVLVISFWIFEPIPIPVTGLLGMALCILFGIASTTEVLASFGDPIIFIFIGTFMLAKALQVQGMDKRIAYALLAHPWVGARAYRTLGAFGLVAWLLAMWMSITACVAMLFPVALAVGNASGKASSHAEGGVQQRYVTSLLLMLIYAAAAGAIATPVGTPTNLIGMEYIQQNLGITFGFLNWMTFAAPFAAIMLVSRYLMLIILFPPPKQSGPGQTAVMREMYQELGPWTPGQRNALIAFGGAILLWMTPGIAGLVLGGSHPVVVLLNQRLRPGVVAILAACLLFILPVDWRKNKFTLTWEEAVQINWGTVLLFGSGIALGKLMLDTGLAAVVGKSLISASHSPVMFVGIAIAVAVIMSEIASNTAAANIVIPIMLSLVPGKPELGLAVALAATFGASLGFMLPVATPGNAIVYSTGAIRMKDMVKAGILVDISGALILWGFMVWVMPYLL